jgi:hypothetical protein
MYQFFTKTGAVDNRSNAMEAGTIKNAASPKNHRSRENQKKTINFFTTIMMVSILFAAAGCKSKKLPSVQAGSTEIAVPFASKEYRSDANFFRATQSGKSPDLSTAKRIALLNARTELGGHIETTMKAVTSNYTNQRTIDNRQEYASKFEEEARAIVNQKLNDVTIIGERVFRESNGGYTYYIAIEMNKDALLQNINNRISKDERLRLDFDQYQFRKIFDEEMKRFENR